MLSVKLQNEEIWNNNKWQIAWGEAKDDVRWWIDGEAFPSFSEKYIMLGWVGVEFSVFTLREDKQ